MRILFEQTGGFAGLRFAVTIDEAELPPEKARELRRMVEEAEFFTLPGRITSQRPQPDRFQYRLVVFDGKKRHTVAVSDDALPAGLVPLVRWLAEAARRHALERT